MPLLFILFLLLVLGGGFWRYRANDGSLSLLEVLVIIILLFAVFGGWGYYGHWYP